jgi:hypothetical protein
MHGGTGSHGQFKPPDHSRGDERTIGGYAAVHERPAAFEGSDGYSYSVELLTAETGEAAAPWGGFVLFIRWARLGAQSPEGHLESDFLVTAGDEASARSALGALPLERVKLVLDELVAGAATGNDRRWWDAMRDEGRDADEDVGTRGIAHPEGKAPDGSA